jgi:metal-dependent amidase/aminoacylase/carboxypeptidase family protein
LARLIQELSAVPQFFSALDEAAQVTVVYARLGQVAFGTSPASATLMATLRAHNDDVMRRIGEQCTYLTAAAAAAWRLESKAFWTEDFPATVNDAHVLATVRSAAHTLDLDVVDAASPFAWSEDFGHFTHKYAGALFGLGAGLSCPALHHPDYDFPDKLIMTGLAMLENAARHLLSSPANGA